MPDWDAIVGQHGRLVWRTAYRLLGNHADASDCFQETFLSALSAARTRRVGNWGGFLQRLATARALDRLRHRRRQAGRGGHLADEAGTSPTRRPCLASRLDLPSRLRLRN